MVEENILPTQTTMEEAPPKPFKPWLKIALLSFLGVVLAGGFVWAGYKLGEKRVAPNLVSPTLIPTIVTPTPVFGVSPTLVLPIATTVATPTSTMATPTPNPTANWKTYSNAGVSFKYPPNWVYEKFDIPGRAELHGLVQLKPENYQPNGPMMPLYIHYWDNPEGLTIEQYDKKINQGAAMLYPLYNSQAQVITLGNLTAYYSPNGDCAPFPCHKYVISTQNKIWEISSQYTNDPNEFKPIIDQILSTCRFLE